MYPWRWNMQRTQMTIMPNHYLCYVLMVCSSVTEYITTEWHEKRMLHYELLSWERSSTVSQDLWTLHPCVKGTIITQKLTRITDTVIHHPEHYHEFKPLWCLSISINKLQLNNSTLAFRVGIPQFASFSSDFCVLWFFLLKNIKLI